VARPIPLDAPVTRHRAPVSSMGCVRRMERSVTDQWPTAALIDSFSERVVAMTAVGS
jgi:hypothetical protein